MKALRQILISFSFAGYVFLAVFGLLAMSYVNHHSIYGMDNCPFMVEEQALCTMNFVEHITALHVVTSAPIVALVTIVTLVLFVFFFFHLHPPNFARSKLYQKPYRESFITSLFSEGLLKPKAPE